MSWATLWFLVLLGSRAANASEPKPAAPAADPTRDADRAWFLSLPAAPKPELTRHGLAAQEIRRWKPRGAGQGVAVDDRYFYGIGNFVVGKYDKQTGERVAEWIGPRGGSIIHLNWGMVTDGQLICAHSNFPELPMASSIEIFDCATLQPVKSISLGVRHGSLTWAEQKDGYWWACFANYNERGGTPGVDNRSTLFGKFDERWQLLEAWIFPPQVVAAWGTMSSSGGRWGDDGLLYVTGHDAKELYVLRLPQRGVALEYVTTIDVPFEGQAFAWDPSERRVAYGITRSTREVVVARIPEIPPALVRR
jgi:hypothetical protein